jgi:hypothetical protein
LIKRRWRNREVLEAPLDLEFRADRATVNVALWELARHGMIRRLERGFYTSVPPEPLARLLDASARV